MAYVGDTARLCQAIINGDLEYVLDWCTQEGVDVNRRDYTGRTALHLAAMASTPTIVRCLVEHRARLIARLVDGRTALHIAAARGSKEIVKILMDKSLANENDEEEKDGVRKSARKAEKDASKNSKHEKDVVGMSDAVSEVSEPMSNDEDSDTMTIGSFVKVDKDIEDEGVSTRIFLFSTAVLIVNDDHFANHSNNRAPSWKIAQKTQTSMMLMFLHGTMAYHLSTLPLSTAIWRLSSS